MRQSISQRLLEYGIEYKSMYTGTEQVSRGHQIYGSQRVEKLHVFAVSMSRKVGRTMVSEVKDRYRCTVNEFEAIKNQETSVTEQYVMTFTNRMENLLTPVGLGTRSYEEWLDVMGVQFGVTIQDTTENQEFWRGRYDHDVKCLQMFKMIAGSEDKAREFFAGVECR